MRLLEVIIISLNLLSLVTFVRPALRWRGIRVLPDITFILLIVHLAIEGYRWQLLPVYILTVAIYILPKLSLITPQTAATNQQPNINQPWLRWLGGGLGFGCIVIGLTAGILLPIPQIPFIAGPYPIGTTAFHWVDPERDEIYTDSPTDKREIMAQIWYPAQVTSEATLAKWLTNPEVIVPSTAERLGLPAFLLQHMDLIQTDSLANVPLATAEERYPVIIYAHGWSGFRDVNVDQIETLASHGYIVVTIDHTYGAMGTAFPDGRLAPLKPETLPDRPEDDIYWAAAERLVDVFAGDVTFTLDQLARLDNGDLGATFAGRLDLNRIGLFGHSTGGGAIVEVCAVDTRCKAGLGMDAWVRPVKDEIITAGLQQPFLFMRSEPWSTGLNEKKLAPLYEALPQAGYRLTIIGTRHRDFTLLPLLSPLAYQLGLKGPINAKRGLNIIDTYLLAFFDKHLRGMDVPLLDGPAGDYPEVIFEKRSGFK